MTGKEVYRKEILSAIPRILSSQDRDPSSPTYGCFDREYWAWATKDFANIDLQRSVYAISLLWKNNFAGNKYYKNEKVLEWITAGLNFWCACQHKDGSFDHLYVNEHSYAATSFTLYEIGETYVLLEKTFNEEFREKMKMHIRRAADFLVRFDELHGFISNHRACTSCALYVSYKIIGDKKYVKKADEYIGSIMQKQSEDGWFNEYGGADPGYQTLDTFYLSCYHKLSGEKKILQMLEKSLKFLAYFVHPNGTIGGEYGSRNTELNYPSGFEYLSEKIPEAKSISDKIREGIEDGSLHLADLDIRNFVPFLTSYTLAFFEHKDNLKNSPRLPYEYGDFEKYFPESQIFIKKNRNYYAIIGISKGGVIKVYDLKSRSLFYTNCGYVGMLKNNSVLSSQMLNYSKNVKTGRHEIEFDAGFFMVPNRVMTPAKFFAFRAFNLTLGRFYRINNLVRDRIIVRSFIMPRKKTGLKMKRKISFSERGIEIKDTINNPGFRFRNFREEGKFTTVFMASSKYYQEQDLAVSRTSKTDYAERINGKRVSEIKREIRL